MAGKQHCRRDVVLMERKSVKSQQCTLAAKRSLSTLGCMKVIASSLKEVIFPLCTDTSVMLHSVLGSPMQERDGDNQHESKERLLRRLKGWSTCHERLSTAAIWPQVGKAQGYG